MSGTVDPKWSFNDPSSHPDTEQERARLASLMRIIPSGRRTLLDVGARDGYIERHLNGRFSEIVAVDLERPNFELDGVTTMQGDTTNLLFPDDTFDTVLCAEVLEHIRPALLAKACNELARVARHDVVIGVPYHQDLRVGRTTCVSCGHHNAPWGHLNSFDEPRLRSLFPGLSVQTAEFIGSTRERTNWLSATLLDMAQNPWGTYNQAEKCAHCGASLVMHRPAGILKKVCAAAGTTLQTAQQKFTSERALWIHIHFSKRPFSSRP